jgi:hypothetical protein
MSARKPIAFDSPGRELLSDDVRCTVLFVAEFRVRVNVATNCLDLSLSLGNLGNDFHKGSCFLKKWFV